MKCWSAVVVLALACGRTHPDDSRTELTPPSVTSGGAPREPAPSVPAGATSFERLPFLEDECRATAVSADGSTAAGYCVAGRPGDPRGPVVSVRWQLDDSPSVTELPLGRPASITALSADGSVAFGNFEAEVFRSSATGTEILAERGKPYDTNKDGTASVGVWWQTANGEGAYLWTTAGGMIALPLPDGADWCEARSLSDDGRLIAGNCRVAQSRIYHAVRWDPERRAEWLPVPSEATASAAGAISADGATIVGNVWIDRYRPARWTEDGLELLVEEPALVVHSVDDDGRRVLLHESSLGPRVWEADGEVFRVLEKLSDAPPAEQWEFLSLAGASGDLRVIVGNLQHAVNDTHRRRGAYLIRLP